MTRCCIDDSSQLPLHASSVSGLAALCSGPRGAKSLRRRHRGAESDYYNLPAFELFLKRPKYLRGTSAPEEGRQELLRTRPVPVVELSCAPLEGSRVLSAFPLTTDRSEFDLDLFLSSHKRIVANDSNFLYFLESLSSVGFLRETLNVFPLLLITSTRGNIRRRIFF